MLPDYIQKYISNLSIFHSQGLHQYVVSLAFLILIVLIADQPLLLDEFFPLPVFCVFLLAYYNS